MSTVSGLSGVSGAQGVSQQAAVTTYNYVGAPTPVTTRKLTLDFINNDGDTVHVTFEVVSQGVETDHLFPAEPGNLTITVDVTPEEE